MTVEAVTFNQSHYRAVATRVREARLFAQENPFDIQDWNTISDEQLQSLKLYLLSLRSYCDRTCSSNDFQLLHGLLTPQDNFDTHIQIMDEYIDVGWSLGIFESIPISKNLAHATVLMHDAGRNVFNGLPIAINDKAANILEQRLFPNFPFEWIHQVEWVTGEEELTELYKKIHNPTIRYAVILKLFDNLGKLANGKLLTLHDYTSESGYYHQQYIPKAIMDGKFPFSIYKSSQDGSRQQISVTAQDFARNDVELCLLGASIIQDTGFNIDDVTDRVRQRINVYRHHTLNP